MFGDIGGYVALGKEVAEVTVGAVFHISLVAVRSLLDRLVQTHGTQYQACQ